MALDEFVALGAFEVFADHFGDQFVEGYLGRPAEPGFGLARIADRLSLVFQSVV